MKVSVIMAPNFQVQPVAVRYFFEEAIELAKEFSEEWNTNTEVWEYTLGARIYRSVHRCLSPTAEENLRKARKILDKYFPEDHPDHEDYEFLVFNVLTVPKTLPLTEAKELEKLGILFENGTMRVRFYKHDFRWDPRQF